MFESMKNLLRTILQLWFMLISVLPAKAQGFEDVYKMFQESKVLNDHFYGFSLYDISTNTYVMNINSDKHFTPASNTKMYTSYAALELLGDSIPGLEYIERGDSLLIWGTGDPTFLHNRLDTRVVYNFLKNTDKRIFVVPGTMKNKPFAHGWAMEDFEAYYQPEISTFPIYGNVVTFRQKGDNYLTTSPICFQSALAFLSEPKSGDFELTRSFHANTFWMSKKPIPRGYVNEVPFIYSDSLFTQLLADSLKKNVTLLSYKKPHNTKILYSGSTRNLIREMMLPSDNFIAEQFLMMCSWKQFGQFDTYLVRDWMKNNFYKFFSDEVAIFDGSGLSSYNKVTPRDNVDLLILLKNKVPSERERFHLFAAGGVDGTLKRTYDKDLGEPFVFAKTGTITSVYNQSGYLVTRKGNRLAFSFMNNNYIDDKASAIRKEMAKIITYIRQTY
ncbi:D-alanyl-D-alanine carboxypeptidase [Sphingobacterium sp. N143]|nr:D-alanyl-D-alanine carboxypeptidase [Sphingobacterium sp. N143]